MIDDWWSDKFVGFCLIDYIDENVCGFGYILLMGIGCIVIICNKDKGIGFKLRFDVF